MEPNKQSDMGLESTSATGNSIDSGEVDVDDLIDALLQQGVLTQNNAEGEEAEKHGEEAEKQDEEVKGPNSGITSRRLHFLGHKAAKKSDDDPVAEVENMMKAEALGAASTVVSSSSRETTSMKKPTSGSVKALHFLRPVANRGDGTDHVGNLSAGGVSLSNVATMMPPGEDGTDPAGNHLSGRNCLANGATTMPSDNRTSSTNPYPNHVLPGAFSYQAGTLLPAAEANALNADSDIHDWVSRHGGDITEEPHGAPRAPLEIHANETAGSTPLGGLVTANPVQETSSLPEAEPESDVQQRAEETRRKHGLGRSWILVLAVLAAVVVIAVAVYAPSGDNGASETSSAARNEIGNSDRLRLLLPDYTLDVIDADAKLNLTDRKNWSPQTKAFDWAILDPNFSTYEDWRLRQRFALACVYYSTGGETSWRGRRNWLDYETGENSGVDEYEWFSLDVNYADYIITFVGGASEVVTQLLDGLDQLLVINSDELVHLRLADNNLTGVIPPELSLLSELRTLDLSFNPFLTGQVPSEIGNLRQLEILSFTNSGLSGFLPTEIGQLSSILALDINYNDFSGTLPSEIGNYQKSWFLNFMNCGLTGSLPSELGHLPAFSLDLSENTFKGSIPTELGQLSTTGGLYLYSNQLEGTIPSELGNTLPDFLVIQEHLLQTLSEAYPNLKHVLSAVRAAFGDLLRFGVLNSGIFLSNNLLTGTIPTEFGKFGDCEFIVLYANMLSGTIPKELAMVPGLEGFDFRHNSLTGSFPKELAMMTGLDAIWLSDNSFRGALPSELGLLTNLYFLRLENNFLTGSLPSEIGLMDGMERLWLSNNAFFGSLPGELGLMDSLESLWLHDNFFAGQIPDGLCNISDFSADCNDKLCGCSCACGDDE